MSRIAQIIGERIRAIRQNRGISQEQLALRASLNSSYVGQVERGEKSPTVDSLDKIVNALETNFEELFCFKQDNMNTVDTVVIDKISYQLKGRTIEDQEAIYNFIKQLLVWRDKRW